MRPGDVVGERYEILRRAGEGGMGCVYQAVDRIEGGHVGLKLMRQQPTRQESERFLREAKLLASLNHPHIVEFRSHGVTASQRPYLAMEWLDGEDLATVLKGDALSIEQTIEVGLYTASALVAAHERGIVHRDIKPRNLFLVGGDPSRLRVLDFGVAHPVMQSRVITATGAIVGTLGYSAPEQIQRDGTVDGRTDLWALGCVLFECLCRRRAFSGHHAGAVLAKILYAATPHVVDEREDVSRELDQLIASMMAKSPQSRPRSAAEVFEALAQIRPRSGHPETKVPQRGEALTRSEQRLVAMLMLSVGEQETEAGSVVSSQRETTREELLESLSVAVESQGVMLTQLAGGGMVLLEGRGDASVHAARAARCALALARAKPGVFIALTIGEAEIGRGDPVGKTIDRAANVLSRAKNGGQPGVFVDGTSAALLTRRYRLEGDAELQRLRDEKVHYSPPVILGRVSPCVGRTRELAFLESTLTECVADSGSAAVLLTGEAGVGKTRLGQELVAVAEERFGARVLVTHGDPLYSGAPLLLASSLICEDANIRLTVDRDRARSLLDARLHKLLPGEENAWLAELLAELVGLPSLERPSPQLVAARYDGRIKNEQMGEAFSRWIEALTTKAPVVLVVEDLHWGDLASLQYINAALRHCSSRPLLVLFIARPEVHELFPELGTDFDVQGLSLGALKPRAARELVSSVLADVQGDSMVERIVEIADGNPFYLEELVRHVVRGDDEALPSTVLAMAHSRLASVDSDARRVLRAGSIFGKVLWSGGMRRLLGDSLESRELARWLEILVEQELIVPVSDDRFPGEEAFTFRHDLLRETVYSTLTESDVRLGHRLAAEWLEDSGEPDPLVLAAHFELAGDGERAVPLLISGAQTAYESGDLRATKRIAERAGKLGAHSESLGRVRLLEALASAWSREHSDVSQATLAAMEYLPEGSVEWFTALGVLCHSGAYGGDPMALLTAARLFQNFTGELPPVGPAGFSGAALINAFFHIGRKDETGELLRRLERGDAGDGEPDPVFLGWCDVARGLCAMYDGLLGDALREVTKARERFFAVRDRLGGAVAEMTVGYLLVETGDLSKGEEVSRRAQSLAKELGLDFVARYAGIFIGQARILRGRCDHGAEELRQVVASGDLLLANIAQMELALGRLLDGEPEEALSLARRVTDSTGFAPLIRGSALAVVAAAELACQQPARARDAVVEARACYDAHAMIPIFESLMRLTHAQVALRLELDNASELVDEGQRLLRRKGATLRDAGSGRAFFEAIGLHRQTMDLGD